MAHAVLFKNSSMRLAIFFIALSFVLLLFFSSLFIGISNISINVLWANPEAREIFLISRVPRSLALLLVGSAMSFAGLIMQLLVQNKFVEPTTIGVTQFAGLGILVITILYPSASVILKMVFACSFSLLGTIFFLFVLSRISFKSTIIVPLIGIMIGAVVHSMSTFLALHFDLFQSFISWESGDFSSVIKGRYELLWIVGFLTVCASYYADRFTIIGMGKDFSVNIGLNYQATMMIGLLIVAVISGIVVVVVGNLPFLGLIVPNIVSMTLGDNVRKNLPWICLLGGGLVLLSDILGRIVYAPYELPAGTILGVFGALVFIGLILRRKSNVH